MEFLAHFFLQLVEALDKSRKPLAKVVPELETVRTDPAAVLLDRPVVIGSAPVYGSVFLLGIAVAALSCLGCGGLLAGPLEGLGKQTPWLEQLLLIVFCYGSPIIGVVLAALLLRRRKVILSLEGVAFAEWGAEVLCPWSLFCVGDEPTQRNEKTVLVPIAEQAIPHVELRRGGQVRATGLAVRSRSFRFADTESIILVDKFRAKGREIGKFLIDVAWAVKRAPHMPGK